MEKYETHRFGRRQWLRRLSIPALAGSLGASLPGIGSAVSEQGNAAPQKDFGSTVYNVRDYGAKGDGTSLDTGAVQAAIDACHRDGGGTVLVPQGTFLIGTVELKSNITLYVAASGKLLGTADGKQYHAADAIPLHGDATLEDGNWALLFAVNAKNVAVEGPGTIDGQGFQFHSPSRGVPPPSGLGGRRRPYLLLFYRCRNLSVRDIDLFQSAYHCVRVIQSSFVHMDGLHIYNRVNSNNDGFHFISSEYVTVSNCVVQSQRRMRPFRQLQVRHGHQLFLQHTLVAISLWRRRSREHRRLQLPAVSGLWMSDQVPRRPRIAL